MCNHEKYLLLKKISVEVVMNWLVLHKNVIDEPTSNSDCGNHKLFTSHKRP